MGVFHFKKFSICDDGAAMKVGTDAVLLGAWAELSFPGNILDIGSGSGVIAVMAAQRTGNDAHIDAVEIQKSDVDQLIENVKQSPWPNRISVFHSAIQDFDNKKKYHHILCNPPFFSKSLLPPLAARQAARHDTALSPKDLVQSVVRLLMPEGKFNVILPPEEGEKLKSLAEINGLYVRRLTKFYSRTGKEPERLLMELRLNPGPYQSETLVLYGPGEKWSAEYRSLTGEFYLDR